MTVKKQNLDSISIVLVEPQVPGNVGAAARAMKNMGLRKLVLVKPWFHNHPQMLYMAHNSEDILQDVIVVDDLSEAVADSVLVVGATRRKRHNTPFMNPKQAVDEILDSSRSGPVSILFGREDKGLTNKELSWCQIHVSIPSSQAQPSINLSQAVMVMAYELFTRVMPEEDSLLDLAPAREIAGMYDHLLKSLTTLGMRQWNEGDNYMKSLRRVFSRTKLEKRDVATIHKLCGEIDKYAVRVRVDMKRNQEYE
ncbi:RNA methyltransferase [Candidatus Latescibacterota bacterium]